MFGFLNRWNSTLATQIEAENTTRKNMSLTTRQYTSLSTMNAVFFALMLFISACSQLPTKETQALAAKGELGISTLEAVTIAADGDNRELSLRIIMPSAAGPFPLIVLSHGTFSSNLRYDLVANYWAQHGYVVLMPQHPDANYGFTPKSIDDMLQNIETRIIDLQRVLDGLQFIEAQNAELDGKIDHDHYIAAGHSIGAMIAMRVTGLVIQNVGTDTTKATTESRFQLLVMLSDPGKMRQMPLTAWTGSTVPTFMSTGSEDYGLMGAREEPKNPNIIVSANNSVDRYQLLLDKGDHYFGGLVQKEVAAEPDHEGLRIFNETSVMFLDAYSKDDREALKYLREVDLLAATNGRATIIQELAIE